VVTLYSGASIWWSRYGQSQLFQENFRQLKARSFDQSQDGLWA